MAYRQETIKYGTAGNNPESQEPDFSLEDILAEYGSSREQKLLQAQRDFFGAHTYERIDAPRGQFFHTNWTGHGGNTSATQYDV